MIETDADLLKRYARRGAEDAFRLLVERHIDMVYSTARRQLGDEMLAEDVTQTVFSDLARKARMLPDQTVLAGWLYQSARFAAAKVVRTEIRRRTREATAMELQRHASDPEPDWTQLQPLLDDAMGELPAADRDAILLRYFQRKDLRDVGAALGVNDDAARKRVARALDRLREQLARRGVATASAALATSLSAHAVTSAPVGLAVAVANSSLAVGAAAATGAAFAAKNLLPALAMTKAKTLLLTAALVAGVATPLALQQRNLARLRSELDALRAQSAELERLRAENARLAKTEVDAQELDNLRQNKAELLRLRGEVGRLRASQAQAASPGAVRHSRQTGTKPAAAPSSQPGYVPADQLADAGFATPEAALQSFYFALNNPVGGRLLRALALPEDVQRVVKEHAVEDLAVTQPLRLSTTVTADGSTGTESRVDFIQEGGADNPPKMMNGYRVVLQDEISPSEQRLQVERELPDGTVTTETQTLTKVGDEWKVQPSGGVQVFAGPNGGAGVFIRQEINTPPPSGESGGTPLNLVVPQSAP
jgi:RNA polymerase sigma factor (sigma-70 family)